MSFPIRRFTTPTPWPGGAAFMVVGTSALVYGAI
jgi:hypothetical protein